MIYKIQKIAFLLLTFSIGLTSCKKQNLDPAHVQAGIGVLYSGINISTSIGGKVTDDSGNPVSNALVTIGSQTINTNQEGIFYMPNVSVDKERAYVKVEKSGYFLGSRSFIPSASNVNYVRIKLLSKTIEGTIDNATGGVVNVAGGPVLTFDPGDVSLENGSSYSGNITVYAYYLDPMATDIGEIMPGDLAAVNNSNYAGTLESYGMVVVELVGSGGEELNVTPGETVGISMPVATLQAASAPSTISLWYFDENLGNWIEEGSASLQGNMYVGEVSHFSFWNCDTFSSTVLLHCRLVCYTTPLANVTVQLTMPSGFTGSDITDGNGEVSGAIQANTSLLMEVIDECGSVIHSQNIPGSSSDVDLGDIFICPSSSTAIFGQIVDCNGSPLSNGYLYVTTPGGQSFPLFTDQNGIVDASINLCSPSTIDVVAYDFSNNMQSATMTIQVGSSFNLGTITTCNQIDEYMNYTVDGTNYSINDIGQDQVYASMLIDSLNPGDSILYLNSYQAPQYFFLTQSNPLMGNNSNCNLTSTNIFSTSTPIVNSITMNITTLGTTPGSYVQGTFTGTANDQSGTAHSITGSFRAKRNN